MKKISDLNLFRAFRSTNYTLYFFGRSISQLGTWMQRTAVIWVVYSITHSAFLTGVTIFAEQFPSFAFSILGGVAADRYNRYKIIKITQIISMIQSVLLAILIISGYSMVWAILVLSVILGIINAFDVPARQSLIHEVVADQADLPNALSLTTATASLAQLLGPALSGIVLNAWGAPVCFLINAASFGGVFLSILLMKLPAPKPKNKQQNVLAEFAEGFNYLKKTPNLAQIIVMLFFISLLVLPFNTVLPVFAKVIFKGDAKTFGYITSFMGIGAVIATMLVASRKPGAHLKRILFISTIMMGIAMICFSQITNFPLAMFFIGITGFGAIMQFTVSNIIIQSESAAYMRGRVIGILLMVLFGMVPLGSLLIGGISEDIGAPTTVLCEGIIAIIIALTFAKFLTAREKKPAIHDESIAATEEIIAEH